MVNQVDRPFIFVTKVLALVLTSLFTAHVICQSSSYWRSKTFSHRNRELDHNKLFMTLDSGYCEYLFYFSFHSQNQTEF